MRIGVPREPVDQPRAAASPQTVERMIHLGCEVLVERGAGARAQSLDVLSSPATAPSSRRPRTWAGCSAGR